MSNYTLDLTDSIDIADEFDYTSVFGTGLVEYARPLQGNTVRLSAKIDTNQSVDNPKFVVSRGEVQVFEVKPTNLGDGRFEYYWDTRYNAPGFYVFVMSGTIGDMEFYQEKELELAPTEDSFRMPWDHTVSLSDQLEVFEEELYYSTFEQYE